MTDIEKLKELEAKATPGPWEVFADQREYASGSKRAVYTIRTRWVHPQSKDHAPVVTESDHALKSGVKGGIWIDEADALLIVAARNALPDLLASLASKDAEIERLKAERDEARELYDFAALARDTVGYLGSVASCIMETDARANSAESRLTTALAALGEARTWHQSEDKALSKSGRGDNDYYWRRAQHQEQIAELNATLAKLNTLEGNDDD